jgi:general secretion pathway protein F
MPGFKFLAYDIDGREQRGVIESDSPRLARATLREQGLFPQDVALIEAANDASNSSGLTRLGRRTDSLSTEQLAGITRQLATLVGAGLTIEGALGALVEQAETERERQVLVQLRASIREGQSLGQAMGLFPQSFAELYRTLVGAGETSGKLPDVLLKLADYVEGQQAMKQKLITAMVYPAIVVVICALVVVGLMLYVVPQVVGVFDATKQTLPLMTRALLGLSTLLKLTWWLWLIAAIGVTITFRLAMKKMAQRRRFHALLLRLPIIGRLIRVREALERAANQVREGVSLSRALQSQNTKPALFPPVMLHLVASGEASGRLPETLSSAARQQQLELETRTTRLAALIEPAMIVLMGVIVLCIVLAVLLPIFELNQLVSR